MAGADVELSLSSEEWKALVSLWVDSSKFPLGDPEAALHSAVMRLCILLGGTSARVGLSARGPQLADSPIRALDGWRPVYSVPLSVDGEKPDDAHKRWIREGAYVEDVLAKNLLRGVGQRRAYLRQELVSDAEFEGTPLYQHFRERGVGDVLLGALPLSDDVEIMVCIERSQSAQTFVTEQRDLLFEALKGLTPVLTRFARSAGYIDCSEPLTPRERVVLCMLLTGRREADIALDLGMGQRSLHQRVTYIYRKFGVASRAQLMALWLNSPLEERRSSPSRKAPAPGVVSE